MRRHVRQLGREARLAWQGGAGRLSPLLCSSLGGERAGEMLRIASGCPAVQGRLMRERERCWRSHTPYC